MLSVSGKGVSGASAVSVVLGCCWPFSFATEARRTSVVIPTSWHRRHVTAAATPGPLATLAHGRKERHHRSFLRLLDRTVDASDQSRTLKTAVTVLGRASTLPPSFADGVGPCVSRTSRPLDQRKLNLYSLRRFLRATTVKFCASSTRTTPFVCLSNISKDVLETWRVAGKLFYAVSP